MTFIFPDVSTHAKKASWWQTLATALEPIDNMMRQPISRTIDSDLSQAMQQILRATTHAHMTNMPAHLQAQLIAALINMQTSFSAQQAGERRQSAKYWRMARVEWTLFEEMLGRENIQL